MTLQQLAVREFIERMHDVVGRLHNAIEDKDTDAQNTALEAIVGLLTMLKAELDRNGGENDEP